MSAPRVEVFQDRGMRRKDLAREFGIGESTLRRWEKTKADYPTGIRLSARCVIFMESDFRAWLLAQKPEKQAA